jgi:ribosome-binding protein aMBF1 (putative translation factor)
MICALCGSEKDLIVIRGHGKAQLIVCQNCSSYARSILEKEYKHRYTEALRLVNERNEQERAREEELIKLNKVSADYKGMLVIGIVSFLVILVIAVVFYFLLQNHITNL